MEEHKIVAGIGTLNIPNEIVFEILKRVCAKSLMRFRCVSKYFCSLISESLFIEAHHKSLAAQFLLHRVDFNPKVKILNNFIFGDEDLGNCLIRYLDEPCFRNLHNMQSSINGLVCLWNYKGDIAICNPFIKEHGFLPKVQPIEKVLKSMTSYLFGFDPTTKKHKVLMGYIACFETKIQVKYLIFTIGVDNSWREISDWWNMFNMCAIHNYVCIDGVIYCENTSRPNIAVFGIVGDEKLIRMISFPNEIILRNMMITIGEIKGQVALLVNDMDFDQGIHKLPMYILNGTCETETWVKHIIELPSLLTKTSLFTTNHKEEIVWIPDTKASHMFLYDIGLKEWRKLEIYGNCQQQCLITDADSALIYLVESICPLR